MLLIVSYKNNTTLHTLYYMRAATLAPKSPQLNLHNLMWPFWPGKGQIRPGRAGSPARTAGKGPNPVQLRLSLSLSPFAVADRKRKEEE
jgi:hypothetical protein